MTGSFQVINGTTEVKFRYQATTALIQHIISDAARCFYAHGYGVSTPFDSLTNQQKLNIVDSAVKDFVTRNARTQHIASAVATTTTTASTESLLMVMADP